ncbi:MAG: hypothetical protein KDA52_06290 [Planctomycetaceae bacterium]|nr:hypothetical protein [Planctomycetaceae bacterium]
MGERIGDLSVEEAAQASVGNWMRFECFCWDRKSEIDDPENWAIVYTHHRDSGLLDLSNAYVIRKTLRPFALGEDPDVVFESHSHWAVGHIDGFSVRVLCDGQPTEAFVAYHQLAQSKAEYPILDEQDYSHREYEATVENIVDAAWNVRDEYDLPDDWQYEVFDWLSDNEPGEVENCDDQGGYPSEESLLSAIEALGFRQAAVV